MLPVEKTDGVQNKPTVACKLLPTNLAVFCDLCWAVETRYTPRECASARMVVGDTVGIFDPNHAVKGNGLVEKQQNR